MSFAHSLRLEFRFPDGLCKISWSIENSSNSQDFLKYLQLILNAKHFLRDYFVFLLPVHMAFMKGA